MHRLEIFQEISARLDEICRVCPTKQRLLTRLKPGEKKQVIDHYCIQKCSVGKELQSLGQYLGTADPFIPDEVICYRSQQPKRNKPLPKLPSRKWKQSS